jgi:hypothetical protein
MSVQVLALAILSQAPTLLGKSGCWTMFTPPQMDVVLTE